MKTTTTTGTPLEYTESPTDTMQQEVLAGLGQVPKRLPSKYFYDRRGSELFDKICELPEYYPTRTETAILDAAAREIAAAAGERVALIELGSGSGDKTRLLLSALSSPAAYIPIEISKSHLNASARRLQCEFPQIEVIPVCADFMQPLAVPDITADHRRKIIFFPGSTIGNLEPPEIRGLLGDLAGLVGSGGGLLLGIDLQKDLDVLRAAYNDASGVTAQFNLNLLHHINNRLGCEIPVDAFEHEATYNSQHDRIEMRLRAGRDLTLQIAGREFTVAAGEGILTEYSHKFNLDQFGDLAAACGWSIQNVWTDAGRYFAIVYAECR